MRPFTRCLCQLVFPIPGMPTLHIRAFKPKRILEKLLLWPFQQRLTNAFAPSCTILLLLLMTACAHDPPVPSVASTDGRAVHADPDRVLCDEFSFDTAQANGRVPTRTLLSADALSDYLAPANNLLGVLQRRFWLRLDPAVSNGEGLDVVWLHGGGADVGMATNDQAEVFHFLELGYRVWVVEYRRGWLASSYDPCLERDPFAATAEDWNRMPLAAEMALADAKTAIADIAAQTSNQLVLYGTSFGASLAMGCGPYAEAGYPAAHNIVAIAAAYGSVPADAELRNPMPTALWHGMRDAVNGPDIGTLYGHEGPLAVPIKGSVRVYHELNALAPTWLFVHRLGHGYGPVGEISAAERMRRCLQGTGADPGAYLVSVDSILPYPG